MANDQQDKSQKLSPLKLLSDNSSEGLPSPDELKRIFFPKNSKAQLRSPLRHSSQTDVIILDDSPPIVQVKVKRKVDSVNYDNDGDDSNSKKFGDESNKVIKTSVS